MGEDGGDRDSACARLAPAALPTGDAGGAPPAELADTLRPRVAPPAPAALAAESMVPLVIVPPTPEPRAAAAAAALGPLEEALEGPLEVQLEEALEVQLEEATTRRSVGRVVRAAERAACASGDEGDDEDGDDDDDEVDEGGRAVAGAAGGGTGLQMRKDWQRVVTEPLQSRSRMKLYGRAGISARSTVRVISQPVAVSVCAASLQ